jgi:hypothetical protein
MLLWVVLGEERSKRRRGAKKEGVQTGPAGNAPRALRFNSEMTEDLRAARMEGGQDKGEQGEGQNLPNDWRSVGADYGCTLDEGSLFITGEKLRFWNFMRSGMRGIVEGEFVLKAPSKNGNRQPQEYKAEPGQVRAILAGSTHGVFSSYQLDYSDLAGRRLVLTLSIHLIA